MSNTDMRQAWLPGLWHGVRNWLVPLFQTDAEFPLPQMLLGTLTALLIEKISPSDGNILKMIVQKCSHAIRNCSDADLYQCNPIQLTLAIRLIEGQGVPLAARAMEYLTDIEEAINSGALFHWQVPAFDLLIRRQLNVSAGAPFDLGTIDHYASNFGQILGQIEGDSAFGMRAADIGPVPRALLYAGASRAMSRNDIASSARALRCLNYVTPANEGSAEVHHLFDAICARQESVGHFGADPKAPGDELRRAFECLWAIAEVSTPYRLFMDVVPPSGSAGKPSQRNAPSLLR
ncbi:hypothetical protein V5F59_11470 [Xanthobacter autotrophicus DSM 431]|uniref:hypothetical protein n=1 Tax=Xanthobacter nonsaccharivorans TaxID=3119912 RepID=UPI003727DADB